MNRSTVGSLVFVGAALVVCMAPESEATAHDGARGQRGAEAGAAAPREPVSSSVQASTPAAAAPEAIAANAGLKTVASPQLEIGKRGQCPDGMLEVEGDYCPELEQPCLRWLDPEGVFPRRCAEFKPSRACTGKLVHKHFCIDRFEWPNKAGENPIVMKTWYGARDACAGSGKRLCGDSEWTLSCEGQERLPYPYGYERNSEACNIDKPHPDVNEHALGSNDPKVRDAEAKRLWQGEPSGARESCISPYGVADMTGNVDEWVMNESGKPYLSGLKGGYWGPVRDRCRPMTTVHAEGFSFYQIGFRCCSDPPGAAKPSAATGGAGTGTQASAGHGALTGS